MPLSKRAACAVVLAVAACLSPIAAMAQQDDPGLREVQVAAHQFLRGAPLPGWVEPITELPATQNKSPLVALVADSQFSAEDTGVYVHRAWQVNDSSALSQAGQQSIDFNPAYQRVRLHFVRIRRAGAVIDKLPTARINFLQREAGLEHGVYSGDVAASVLIDDLRVGDVLEVAYTLEGRNPVLGSRYVELASWDQAQPTEWRRVTLTHALGRAIAWKAVGDMPASAPAPQVSESGGRRRLRWEARGLPQATAEQDLPDDFIAFSFLQFSEYQSWADVAAWAQELFSDHPPSREALQPLVAEFTRAGSDKARAAAALFWVQKEIRYFSLALGENSHRPASPATTLQRRYGDCKDKSILLVELLRAMGIQADPVLVTSRARKGQSKLLPSPSVFDHVIVRAQLDGRDYFLDPTRLGQTGRLDALGQIWEGAEVLVVAPGTSAFTTVRTPDFDAISRNELTEKIRIDQLGGTGRIQSRQVVSGVFAEGRRLLFATWPADQREKFVLEPYEQRYPGARLVRPLQVQDYPENNVMAISFEVEVPALAAATGPAWAVRFRPNNIYGSIRGASAARQQPLALSVPRRIKYAVEVEFPPDVSRMADPLQRVVRDPAFQYEVTMGFRGNRATASMEMQILADRVEPARMSDYLANLRRAGDHPFAFVVSRADIRPSGFLGLGTPSLQKTIETRLKDRIEKITRTVDTGRLTGDDLAEALCERAEARVDLGDAAAGLKDAQDALKAAPNLARAFECRANAWFGVGDYQRAVADYGKSISLDPDQSQVFYRRGHARYYLGQYAAAADDFGKAGLEGKGGESDRLYPELWRLWAQKRMGVAPTPAQASLAASNPNGEWPRPALALFAGRTTVDAMLRSLETKTGDEREMALVEGYFYAGQWYLLNGDKAAAADYFRKARSKGVTMYIEHVSAGIELGKLEEKGR